MAKEMSLTEARACFASLCDLVATSRDSVIITRRGRRIVALVPGEGFNSLNKTVHLFRSPKNGERLLRVFLRARGESMKISGIASSIRKRGERPKR